MKLKKLYQVPLSRLLVVSYAGLLVFIAIIRFVEYKQTRDAGTRINEIAKLTSQKLKLLATISNADDSARALTLQYFSNPDPDKVKVNARLIGDVMASNEGNFSSYRKLISSGREQKLFDELYRLNKENSIARDSLLFQHISQNHHQQKDVQLFHARQKNSFDRFHNAGDHLSELISVQSEKEINDINQYIFRLARRKEITSYLIIALLLVVGLNIGNILKRLRRTENKYRLLFDLGPMPKYFIDSTSFRILEVNRAAIHKYDYSEQEFLKMSVFELGQVNDLHKREIINQSLLISKPGNVFETQAKHFKKNGEVLDVQINAGPIYINNKKLFLVTVNDITEKEKLERELTKATITAQEKERQELAAELHDNICQILASSRLYLDMTKEKDAVSKDEYIQEAKKYINLALSETRNLSHRVTPAFVEEASLVEVIDNLLEEMNPDNSLQIEFRYDAKILWHKAPTDLKLNLYRICQEQISNIRKYSNATMVMVELELKSNLFRMIISDNGVGFDVKNGKDGIGLMNMKKRAESFSGTFSIDSSPNNGCTIEIEIPLMTICEH